MIIARYTILILALFMIANVIPNEQEKVQETIEIKYVGNFASEIEIYNFTVFDEIMERMFKGKKMPKFEAYKPKKIVEDVILASIHKQLAEYNLAFGDLFIGPYAVEENTQILALVLIYHTLEPKVRYYQLREKKK